MLSPELIGVIIGGLIGLATAALGHAVAWFQLKSSRAFDLRQAIYIDAAASMAKGLEYFSNVTQLDVDDLSLAALIHPASIAMFKIHVVAKPPTISALSKVRSRGTRLRVDDAAAEASAFAGSDRSGVAGHLAPLPNASDGAAVHSDCHC